MKRCCHCKKVLPLNKFYKDNRKPLGLTYACKDCEAKRQREYYKSRTKTQREHYNNLYRKRSRKLSYRFRDYKKSARIKKIKFNLTKKEFSSFWNKPCFYCGIKIKGIGLDRIDNSKDYSIKNLVPCCKDCNLMKRTMSQKEFVKRCKKISKKFS